MNSERDKTSDQSDQASPGLEKGRIQHMENLLKSQNHRNRKGALSVGNSHHQKHADRAAWAGAGRDADTEGEGRGGS